MPLVGRKGEGPAREIEFCGEDRIERDDAGNEREQRAGNQEGDEDRHSAWRAFEMIDQERQQQELADLAELVHALMRGRIRPEQAREHQREKGDRQYARRPLQRLQKRARLDGRHQRDQPQHHAAPVPVVVHGNRIAMSTARRSTLRSRTAGLFQSSQRADGCASAVSFLTNSVIPILYACAAAVRAKLAHAAAA
jgi:hypothetical protein